MRQFRQHVQQQFVGYVALFVALGGVSYAAAKLPANSVGPQQIRPHAVTGSELANNAITSPKVKDGSLLAADFKSGQLPRGAKGSRGSPGPIGATGATGPATGPASGDLTGTYPAPTIKDGAVSAAKLAPEAPDTLIGAPPDLEAPCDVGGGGYFCVYDSLGAKYLWSNFGQGFAPGAYRRDARGVVHLSGGVSFATVSPVDLPDCSTSTDTIFYLPVGYRPAATRVFATVSGFDQVARIDVGASGKVTCVSSRDRSFVSLDGISFIAAP